MAIFRSLCLQALSYYKIFGYPTGLGALLVRRDAVQVLRKRFFGGGTVEVSVSNADFFRCRGCSGLYATEVDSQGIT